MNQRTLALLAGPLLFLLIAALPAPAGMPESAKLTTAITLWIAVWWITEPVDLAVTSLLPLVLFPLTGVARLKDVSGEYGNEIIFLFIAGFFFGKTIERWHLHRRIALRLVMWLGSKPSRVVLGFMVASAFISMWVSNTATAVMMTPVAIAVAVQSGGIDRDARHFQKALLLGVGYACSIGGLATLIGTPTNAIFVSYVKQKMDIAVSFWQWFLFGLPFTTVLLVACWGLLLWLFPLGKTMDASHDSRDAIREDLAMLGRVTMPERRLMWLFGVVILAWITGSLVWYKWVPNCNDVVVAVAGGILLFLVPSGDGSKPLLDWDTALRIPWGIILLFGGGLALAKGFDQSGLAAWLGERMTGLSTLSHLLILLTVLTVVVLLSEVASNIATASMMMPVLAALAVSIGMHPFGLLLSATLAASFGFGLPVATAPNTIVYSSGYLTTRDMAKAGFILDAVAIVLLLIFLYAVLPFVWGISL
ncbi:MAG: DASS family sodium-coupled anion symporter [Saprospiraceae bacterium]|nr:DASS family sodium-coupled anion symporter [Saprospiraceae bacterium]